MRFDAQVLEQFIIEPSAEHLKLNKLLFVLVLLIHLPYAVTMIGGALLSFVTRLRAIACRSDDLFYLSEFARKGLISRTGVYFLLGFMPFLTLIILYPQIVVGAAVPAFHLLWVAFLSQIAGYAFLRYYSHLVNDNRRNDFAVYSPLLVGLLLLFGTYRVTWSVIAYLNHPEEWPFYDSIVDVLFSWNITVRCIELLLLGAALTGATLMAFVNWCSGCNPSDDQKKTIYRWGTGLVLVGVILTPLFVVWEVFNTPEVALGPMIFALWILTVLLLLLGAVLALRRAFSGCTSCGGKILLVLILVLGVTLVKGHFLREYALQEHFSAVARAAEEKRAEREQELKSLVTAQAGPDIEAGRAIYEQRCSACHSWDKRVVGPPYMDRVPKYLDDIEGLKNFIKNPVKVDQDYPPMAPLGLNDRQINDVAHYLIDEYKKRAAK